MIKFVREYTTAYSNEKHYDVIHETNGKRRWFYYLDTPPKTVARFMEGKTPIPYTDTTFNEKGNIYGAD